MLTRKKKAFVRHDSNKPKCVGPTKKLKVEVTKGKEEYKRNILISDEFYKEQPDEGVGWNETDGWVQRERGWNRIDVW